MAEGVYKSYVNRVGESLLWHARSLSSKAEDERAEVNEEVKEEPKEPANEMADGRECTDLPSPLTEQPIEARLQSTKLEH